MPLANGDIYRYILYIYIFVIRRHGDLAPQTGVCPQPPVQRVKGTVRSAIFLSTQTTWLRLFLLFARASACSQFSPVQRAFGSRRHPWGTLDGTGFRLTPSFCFAAFTSNAPPPARSPARKTSVFNQNCVCSRIVSSDFYIISVLKSIIIRYTCSLTTTTKKWVRWVRK